MAYLLGVDAGNTKTIALVAHGDGAICGVGRSGCGDIYGARSSDHAIAAIETAIAQALAMAKIERTQLVASAFSAAGADWPEDIAFIGEALTQLHLPIPKVYNDAIGALRAGTLDGCGVVVVVGTGAAVGARHPNGQLWHSSFWQQVGGAGHLAQQALQAMYAAELQMGPPTALTAAILAHFGMTTAEQVLHALTARATAAEFESRFIHPRTGGVARVLLDVAEQGDSVARDIVLAHGAALGAHAIAAARQVGLDRCEAPFPLVLIGGVLRHPSPQLVSAIVRQVQGVLPLAQPSRNALEPALGALLLAFDQLNLSPIALQECRENMLRTQPDAAWFDT